MPELSIALSAKQIEFYRAIERTENVFYGGAKGGGKSHGLREIMVARRCEYPNSRGVIFRKTYPELYGNHIEPLLTKFPALRDRYSQQHKEITFENGSKLMFRHCQYFNNLQDHQGQEYHDLAIEEVGEWPEDWFWILKGSNRTSTPGIKPKCLLTGNPGGVGHKWLKRLFILRDFRTNERPEDYAFVQALVYDNPALMKNDPMYIERLKANKNKMLVKAYLDGDWDLMAGQYFDMVSRGTHVVEPFVIPDHWRRFGAFDTGYAHPGAFGWFAADEDGNVYLYRELVEPRLRTEEWAQRVMEFPDSAKLQTVQAGRDCWNKHEGGPSVSEKFGVATGNRLFLTPANIDRIAGAQQLRDYLVLRPYKDTHRPKFMIFKTCPVTYDCLTRMTHDPNNPEDVLKVDADDGDVFSGDDPYDMARYGILSRPRASVPVKEEIRDKYARKRKAHSDWRTV